MAKLLTAGCGLNSFAGMSEPARIGHLSLGKVSRVVGTITSPQFKFAKSNTRYCDIAELRVDQMPGVKNWLKRGQRIESGGIPVIVTARLAGEGGAWKVDGQARLNLYADALKSLSAVDVELQSNIVGEVSKLARTAGKCCIVSFHDFKKTPRLSELKRVATTAQRYATVIKIVTMLETEEDMDTLWDLLACKWDKPLCVMGMGPLGRETRLLFPLAGSCLTYGYLDEPAAPGQLSSATLVKRLGRLFPKYAAASNLRRR
jgi:3-dehydroquinate dehydratase-1